MIFQRFWFDLVTSLKRLFFLNDKVYYMRLLHLRQLIRPIMYTGIQYGQC